MATVQHAVHDTQGEFEPSLFGTYSKKIGMWLFLASDSLTFGALLFAYSYGRISNPAWPTPLGKERIANATVMTAPAVELPHHGAAVMAANRGDKPGPATGCLRPCFSGPRSRFCMRWSDQADREV
jgi:heme/copper-type cytochrome/quinol oxidase subunit 3